MNADRDLSGPSESNTAAEMSLGAEGPWHDLEQNWLKMRDKTNQHRETLRMYSNSTILQMFIKSQFTCELCISKQYKCTRAFEFIMSITRVLIRTKHVPANCVCIKFITPGSFQSHSFPLPLISFAHKLAHHSRPYNTVQYSTMQ